MKVPLRPLAAPAAFLLAATIVVLAIHSARHASHPVKTPTVATSKTATTARPRVYIVRAGDTLASIAGKTGVGTSRILRLNPKLQPTSLFLGEKVRLR